jgi:hypothetical protein
MHVSAVWTGGSTARLPPPGNPRCQDTTATHLQLVSSSEPNHVISEYMQNITSWLRVWEHVRAGVDTHQRQHDTRQTCRAGQRHVKRRDTVRTRACTVPPSIIQHFKKTHK